jgi:L-ribulose-5-phosphate 3-epimerase UlaE
MGLKHQIGIMQGRLTNPKGRGIQFFPFDNWEKEFYTAQKLELDEIEFIFDYDNYVQNPLWTPEGIKQIEKLKEETGIQINTVCFDYFMRRPFYKAAPEEQDLIREENTKIIKQILGSMEQLGIGLIEVPLVDASSLSNNIEKAAFREWLLQIVESTNQSIRFGLETDLNPMDFLKYLKGFNSVQIGANYDSGNSSGMGYDVYEEVTILKDYIYNIHIKDRVYHGTTVQLGTGSADFDRMFQGLKKIGYRHNFILQAARGTDGEEESNISEQIEFVKKCIEKYSI